jgi:hypothetical protein
MILKVLLDGFESTKIIVVLVDIKYISGNDMNYLNLNSNSQLNLYLLFTKYSPNPTPQ